MVPYGGISKALYQWLSGTSENASKEIKPEFSHLSASTVELRNSGKFCHPQFLRYCGFFPLFCRFNRETATRYLMITWQSRLQNTMWKYGISWTCAVFILNCRPVYPMSSLVWTISLIETKLCPNYQLGFISRCWSTLKANFSRCIFPIVKKRRFGHSKIVR